MFKQKTNEEKTERLSETKKSQASPQSALITIQPLSAVPDNTKCSDNDILSNGVPDARLKPPSLQNYGRKSSVQGDSTTSSPLMGGSGKNSFLERRKLLL